MRWWTLVVVLAGCEGGVYTPTSSDPLVCADPADEPVDGSMTILAMRSGVVDLYPIFVNDTQYEEHGAAACRDPESGRVTWIFESGGEPLGRLSVTVSTVGNIDFQATDSSLELEIFGTDTTYGSTLTPDVLVTHQDFASGGWVVDALSPELQTTLQGETFAGPEYVVVNLSAAATTL